MPTYEYKCKNCNYLFEEMQSISANPLVVCPKCAQPSLLRLLSSGAGLVFKGSGFYLTDYKKSNSSTNTTKSADKSIKTDTKTDQKSDSNTKTKIDSSSKS